MLHRKSFIPVEQAIYNVTLQSISLSADNRWANFEVKTVEEKPKYYTFRSFIGAPQSIDILAGQLLDAYDIDAEFKSITAVFKELVTRKDQVVKLQVKVNHNEYTDGSSTDFANPVFIA